MIIIVPECERIDEAQDVAGRVLDVVGDHAGRGADATVVDEDDLAVAGDPVEQSGIPVVEVAAEVLKEQQRRRIGPAVAEPAIDERRPSISTERFRR